MPGDEIDSTALPVAAVADLDSDDPTPSLEPSLHRSSDRGVRGIEQAIELRTVPERPNVQSPAERAKDRVDRPHAQRQGLLALEHRDGSPAHPGAGRERLLRESLSNSQDPGDAAEPFYVHPLMVGGAAYGALTGRLSAQPPQ